MIEKRQDNVNIRMRESMVAAIDGLARMSDMNRSEWVCMVIAQALEVEHRRYIALDSIFGEGRAELNKNGVKQCNTSSVESGNDYMDVSK